MTKTTRIALALSSSILSLGVALAPTAFAAGTQQQAKTTHAKSAHHHKASKAKSATKAPSAKHHAQPAAKAQ